MVISGPVSLRGVSAFAGSPFTLPVTLTVQAVPYTTVSGSKLSFTTTAGIDPVEVMVNE